MECNDERFSAKAELDSIRRLDEAEAHNARRELFFQCYGPEADIHADYEYLETYGD